MARAKPSHACQASLLAAFCPDQVHQKSLVAEYGRGDLPYDCRLAQGELEQV